MRYYIADCHFYHRNLLTEMDNRDFESVEQMNEVMTVSYTHLTLPTNSRV